MHPIHKFADMVGVFCDRLTAYMDADFKESEHPRAEDGKFGNKGGEEDTKVRVNSVGRALQEKSGFAGVSTERWDYWVDYSNAINAALDGKLKIGDPIGSGFEVKDKKDIEEFKKTAQLIQQAAKNNIVFGSPLSRAETYDSLEELKAQWPEGQTVTLNRLTAVAATQDFDELIDAYAPKEGNEGRVRVLVSFSNKPQYGVQAAHAGKTGVSLAKEGDPVSSDEVILPKGVKYKVESYYEDKQDGLINVYLTPVTPLKKDIQRSRL